MGGQVQPEDQAPATMPSVHQKRAGRRARKMGWPKAYSEQGPAFNFQKNSSAVKARRCHTSTASAAPVLPGGQLNDERAGSLGSAAGQLHGPWSSLLPGAAASCWAAGRSSGGGGQPGLERPGLGRPGGCQGKDHCGSSLRR